MSDSDLEKSESEPYPASESEYAPSESDSIESSEEENNNDIQPKNVQETKRKGRKRLREPNKHESAVRKQRRNAGLEYISSSNKKVGAKVFNNADCACKRKCFHRILEEERKSAFNKFWQIGNFSAQNSLLCGLVKQEATKRSRPRDGSKPSRTIRNVFYIQCKTKTFEVCKQYFLQTYAISDGRMTRALKRVRTSSPGEDLRGKHPPGKKTPEEQSNVVRQHIDSFPSYQSHYTRKHNPNRKYLSSNLNIRLMYKLYLEICTENNELPVSEAIYRQIFRRDFNLHFHCPQKDTCSKCDAFKMKIDIETDPQTKRTSELEHTLHLRKAEKARGAMCTDKLKGLIDNSLYTFTFDLEKALPFPVLTCSVAYYKRNCYVYNFGCHDLVNDQGYMYSWDETTASRGSQEISSCIFKHITENAANKEHIIAFSDACTGQNRNIKTSLMWIRLMGENNNIKTIDHKFLVSGHSFLPNDRDFGSIEQQAKGKTIYVPTDWYNIIRKARSKKPFKVCEMQQKEFFATKNLEKAITKRKINTDGRPVNWLHIQWLRFRREEPYKIYYKETIDEDFSFFCIDITPGTRGRPHNLLTIQLESLYKDSLPVTTAKKKNMIELLQFIPPVHQQFFTLLKTGEEVEDIGELNDVEDDENE